MKVEGNEVEEEEEREISVGSVGWFSLQNDAYAQDQVPSTQEHEEREGPARESSTVGPPYNVQCTGQYNVSPSSHVPFRLGQKGQKGQMDGAKGRLR